MSIKTNLISELKAVAEDLKAAENLEPICLVANSAYETAGSKETFKDRIIDNATKGFQALERLRDRVANNSAFGGMVRLWSKPTIPSIVIREHLDLSELTQEQPAHSAESIAGSIEMGVLQIAGARK